MSACVFEARGVYGRELFYPLNTTAERIAALLNRRSLTRLQLQAVKDLGFDVTVRAPAAPEV